MHAAVLHISCEARRLSKNPKNQIVQWGSEGGTNGKIYKIESVKFLQAFSVRYCFELASSHIIL